MRSSIVGTLIVPFLIIVFFVIHVTAVPPLPAEFYGSITIDGKPAPVGTRVSAQINGVEKGSFITIVDGFYGGPGLFDNRLKVNVSEEEYRPGELKIVFLINGQQAAQNADFEPGSSMQLDISTGGAGSNTQPDGYIIPSAQVTQVQGQTSAPSGITPTPTPGAGTITYGLDQPRTFTADDGLSEISFTKDTMLFSPEGQFLNVVGLRSKSVADLPPFPANQSIRFTGYAYQIIPEGTYFNPKGVLTFKLPPERAYEIIQAGPVVYEYLPQTASWEPVNTASNVFTNLITADIYEAAIYGLFTPSITSSMVNTSGSLTALPVENVHPDPIAAYNGTNQSGVDPIITPQSIITPQDIITPLPLQEVTSASTVDIPVNTVEPPVTPEVQKPVVRTGQVPLQLPGMGLISAIASVIRSKLSGPVLAVCGFISIIIVTNMIVYAVYRYWWQQRDKNG
jgi:hypothetical protein